jgi:membrane associated rhomboid family serine protease
VGREAIFDTSTNAEFMTLWVRRLLVANAVVFLLTSLQPGLSLALAFYPPGVLARPWTAITYMFVHADIWHILFNMVALYFFGPRLEERLGSRVFLTLYITSGLAGALLSFLTPNALIVGASGAVFGVQLGFARYWPRERIYIWGVLPLEAWVLVLITTYLSLRGGFSGGDGTAHWAHLGGYLGAAVFLFVLERTNPARRFRAQAGTGAVAPMARVLGDRASAERWARIRPEELHEVNRTELERIRRRIDESGVGSLSSEDRAFLDRFSSRAG